jgi:hypothetical protein
MTYCRILSSQSGRRIGITNDKNNHGGHGAYVIVRRLLPGMGRRETATSATTASTAPSMRQPDAFCLVWGGREALQPAKAHNYRRYSALT